MLRCAMSRKLSFDRKFYFICWLIIVWCFVLVLNCQLENDACNMVECTSAILFMIQNCELLFPLVHTA